MNSSIPGSTTLLIYSAHKPCSGRFDVSNFIFNASACAKLRLHVHGTRRECLLQLSRLHLYFITSFVFRQNSGLIRVVYEHRGPLISVVLSLHIAKIEQRLCTVILVKVTVYLSLLFGIHSREEVKFMDITGKLYINLPVMDFPKDDPGLMCEKIYCCCGIFRCLPLLSGG